jgi:adenylate kinase family enzyme
MRERVKNRAVTSGRLDDTEEIFNRRLENFENENQAVLACFLTQGRVLFVS